MVSYRYHIKPFGDQAVLLQFEESVSEALQKYITSVYKRLQKESRAGLISLIPAYDSITITFHPLMTNKEQVMELIHEVCSKDLILNESESVFHEIPVCYDLGADITEVLGKLELTFEELVSLHSEKSYLVHFLGFVPGFMYLGGLDERLHIDRKKEPRLKIPAGAVALGGDQTGIYPLETPGGWQIIGQTPVPLFHQEKGAMVTMGDRVKFCPISVQEYEGILKKHSG